MAGIAKIVVHPAGADNDLLPAKDALTQILDFIELLNQAQPIVNEGQHLTWLLKDISSNSPITAQVLGASADPALQAGNDAAITIAAVANGIDAAMNSRNIPHWMLNGGYVAARRFFARNTENVGRTDISFEDKLEPIFIPSAKARIALINLERAVLEEEKKIKDWTHKAYGVIEGIVVDTTTYYSKPAIRVRERRSHRDVICVFDPDTADKVGSKYSWRKTWDHGPVRVEGLLHYDKDGNIFRVSGSDVVDVASKSYEISDFADGTFTNGLTPAEYLQYWRTIGRGRH